MQELSARPAPPPPPPPPSEFDFDSKAWRNLLIHCPPRSHRELAQGIAWPCQSCRMPRLQGCLEDVWQSRGINTVCACCADMAFPLHVLSVPAAIASAAYFCWSARALASLQQGRQGLVCSSLCDTEPASDCRPVHCGSPGSVTVLHSVAPAKTNRQRLVSRGLEHPIQHTSNCEASCLAALGGPKSRPLDSQRRHGVAGPTSCRKF